MFLGLAWLKARPGSAACRVCRVEALAQAESSAAKADYPAGAFLDFPDLACPGFRGSASRDYLDWVGRARTAAGRFLEDLADVPRLAVFHHLEED